MGHITFSSNTQVSLTPQIGIVVILPFLAAFQNGECHLNLHYPTQQLQDLGKSVTTATIDK